MRRKLRIFSNIAIICLSVCMFAFGVYAASTVSVTTSGTVSFTATDVYAKVERTIDGAKVNPAKIEEMIDASVGDGDTILMNADLEFDSQATPIVISFEITNLSTENNRDIYVQVAEGPTMTSDDNVTKVAYYLNSEIAIAPNSSAIVNIELSVKDTNMSAMATYDYSISLKNTSMGTVLDDTMATFTPIKDKTDTTKTVGYSIGSFTAAARALEKITIPSSYKGLPLTTLGNSFSAESSVTHITFPNTLTHIVGNDLYNFQPTDLSLPGVVEIGENAFYCVGSPLQVTAPNLKILGGGAFGMYNESISQVKVMFMPKLETVGDYGLNYHTQLEYFILPETLTSLGRESLGFTKCTIRVFPTALEVIPDYCYVRVMNKKIILSDSVIAVGDSAFIFEGYDVECVLGANVKTVASNAFTGSAHGVKKVTINAAIESIGSYAFAYADEVIYLGTMEQWAQVQVSSDAFGVYDEHFNIQCLDGVVAFK